MGYIYTENQKQLYFTRGYYTCLRFASILNHTKPVFVGGAQNNIISSLLMVVSNSLSHCVLC